MESLKTLLFVACAVVFLAEVSPQPNRIQGRIIGGYDVSTYQLTYQVSIHYTKANHHICSGAILSDRWVITAAKCIHEYPSDDLQIFYGARCLSECRRTTEVTQVFIHEEFGKYHLEHDLTMLYTSTKIRFDVNVVDKIRLPMHESVDGEAAMVSGWGASDNENFELSDRLQVLSTKVMTQTHCRERSGNLAQLVHETSLCTENEVGKGICVGDLGSPLVSKSKEKSLIGVASWYNGCAEGKPDVFTAIYPHLEWINGLLKSKS